MAAADIFDLPDTFAHNGWSVRYLTRHINNDSSSAPANPWVVFMHSTPWSSDVFQPIANALSAGSDFNFVLYNLARYGQSQTFSVSQAKSELDTSIKAQAKVLTALLQHLHLNSKDRNISPHIIIHNIARVILMKAHLLHRCEYRSLYLLDINCVLP